MELRLKPLLITLLLLLILAAGVTLWLLQGGNFALPVFGETPRPPFKATLFPTASTTADTITAPVEVHFGDDDARWNWQWNEACQAEMEQYVRSHWPVAKLSFKLVNDSKLPLGVAYPDMEHAQAMVLTSCDGEADGLTCAVSISKGQAGDALNVATMSALLYGVQEFYRPKVRTDWEAQKSWDWSSFAPLVRQEEGVWQSECLTVFAP